jgi:hypothetical protein
MIRYEVTVQADPATEGAVERHLRREHIPEILASGCFHRIRLDRASPARFRTSYEARTQSDLDRYLRDHSPRLRADFQAHFPAGVTVTRETWTQLESWG